MSDIQQTSYPEEVLREGPVGTDKPSLAQAAADREKCQSAEVVSVGSVLQSLAGAAAVVLTIVGLSTSGEAAFYTTGIVTIVVGIGLISYGSSLLVRFNELLVETAQGHAGESGLGTGVTAEILGGLAGIAMGVLALSGVAPTILPSVVPIVFGIALLLSSEAITEMSELRLQYTNVNPSIRRMTRRTTIGAAGMQSLAGIAATVLGILAVLGIEQGILTEIGILCVGAALLFAGGAISTRMITLLGRSL